MKKNYIKPEMAPYEMAPLSIMQGSVTVRNRVGISSFRTDDSWWSDGQGGNQSGNYSFWSED